MSYVNFKLDIDGDGIALVTWDVPDRSMNVLRPGRATLIPSRGTAHAYHP